jgi:glycosyltransferase involved in cell wall biosynthesis
MTKSVGIGPPTIEPVADGMSRPLWSVMIPTFNCAHQAGHALESVLVQAPSQDAMEIIVVDDASSDDIAAVVAGYGERVRLHRQPANLGVPANLTEAIRLSRGKLIHILHGDDQVRPGFYKAMEVVFGDAEIGAAFCRQIFANHSGDETGLSPLEQAEPGRLPDALWRLASEQRIMTPSICVRREVYEYLGGFHPVLKCAEDWEMWVRIAKHYPIAYIPEPLAVYRMQDASNTGRNVRSGRDVAFNGIAIDLIRAHLPDTIADSVARSARETYARTAFDTARSFAKAGDLTAAHAQFVEGLKLSKAPRLLPAALRTLANMMVCKVLPRRGSQPDGSIHGI